MSQKTITFAHVIELNRHIEILLLSNDCVIVPNLGGFMTHHIDARYDAEENLFLPPLRTLGFNPQLTINDSLLAQSYIEAYDLSYPEAMRRIESEVAELKQLLHNEGYYALNGIGELSMTDDGRILFEPCEAGILTPTLYGLSSFELQPLQQVKEKVASRPSLPSQSANEPTSDDEPEATVGLVELVPESQYDETPSPEGSATNESEHTIVIKMSWVRNVVAVAAAIAAFFLIAPPIANSESLDSEQVSMSQMELIPLPKMSEPKAIELPEYIAAPASESGETQAAATEEATPLNDAAADAGSEKTVEQPTTPAESGTTFCLVLASQVAKSGADHLVSQMQKLGYDDTRVYVHNNVRRVVYGHFKTRSKAYGALERLRASSNSFDEAWVYQID